MASNNALRAVPSGGMLQGYGNLAAKETGSWWKTRKWLAQVLIWAGIVNGILAMVLWVAPQSSAEVRAPGRDLLQSALELLMVMGSLAPAVGVVILGQDTIIDEKKSGTAAWILSKPISRSAFVLAKFFSHALGVGVTMVLIQGAIAYAQIAARTGQRPALLAWLGALALLYLFLLYFLALTLMLGTFFSARGPVVGIPLALLFGYQLFTGALPQLAYVPPYLLTISLGPTHPAVALQLLAGKPLDSPLPIVLTVACIALFIGVAVWRFRREEL